MAPPGSHSSGPLRAGIRPRRPHGAAKSQVPPRAISFWWLWPVATGAAAAMMTAVAEQQLHRGVPTMVGAIGGLIIGGVEAAPMTRRSRGHHLGWRRLIWLALATMVCLALALSALVLEPRLCHRRHLGRGHNRRLLHLSTMRERPEWCLMLSRVEWVKRTVTGTTSCRTPPQVPIRGHRRYSRYRTFDRPAGRIRIGHLQ